MNFAEALFDEGADLKLVEFVASDQSAGIKRAEFNEAMVDGDVRRRPNAGRVQPFRECRDAIGRSDGAR